MTVKVALVISDKIIEPLLQGKGSIRKVQTEIEFIISLQISLHQ